MKSILNTILIVLFAQLFFSCSKKREIEKQPRVPLEFNSKRTSINDIEKKYWFLKDYINDTIPGISLELAYNDLLKNKKGDEVVIAVIDTEVDVRHKDLKGHFWLNKDEIANNGIDDDKNGYIDDIYGWNFIGNNNGSNIIYTNYEYTRYIKYYDTIFKDKEKSQLTNDELEVFNEYSRANEKYNSELKTITARAVQYEAIYSMFKSAESKVKEILQDSIINIEKLDSLGKLYPKLEQDILLLSNSIKHNVKEEDMLDQLKFLKNSKEKYLNSQLNDRAIVGDDPNDLNDTKYGNPNVSANIDQLYHSTLVTGVILSKICSLSTECKSLKNIKIMPLCISANGDEYDKDIALAIRYAVNNGAKVINISSGKTFSLHKNWVIDAIKYANENNVLVVNSAGNNNEDLDLESNYYYPNDNGYEDVLNNFIKVGATTYEVNQNIKYPNSSYGKNNVDVFAPGFEIYTSSSQNESGYEYVSGTSFATPLVSLVGGILYSYYPKMSVAQIKNIILESGIQYEVVVNIKENDSIKFSELSKSGKVVNAYNALLMAEKMSNTKY